MLTSWYMYESPESLRARDSIVRMRCRNCELYVAREMDYILVTCYAALARLIGRSRLIECSLEETWRIRNEIASFRV